MVNLFDDPDIPAGSEEVDDYDIKKEIGRGGDGTVYLGYDRKVGREVAIKLINSDRRIDETTERRFQAESEAIASLDHPNIIPIYANGKMDGRPFYTMKHVTGGSLATRLDDFAEPGAAAALMIKVARAIHHAHERGILHRDLKPSNILLDEQLEPYISDFGLAKRFDENLNLTLTGAVMGTPSYMSPEQAKGDNAQITTTSDVFSLGSIFYQTLTGRLPFIGDTSHHVLRNVIETQIRFPQESRHNIDKDLETVCLKCLEKDPERRYPTALALAEDLERWQKHLPVRARRATPMERTRQWIRRHPLPAGALSLATLSLIAGSIISLVLWRNAESAREDADIAKTNAEEAKEIAEGNAYFASVANAMSALEDLDLGETRRILFSTQENRRSTEWRLIDGLSRGDQVWTTHFGDTLPVNLTHDKAHDRYLLLTDDRHFHQIDLASGRLTHVGTLPDTLEHSLEGLQAPGLRHFEFSPDGKHYAFIDNNQLLVVDVEENKLIFQETTYRGSGAIWLDSNRILQATRPIDNHAPDESGHYQTAWIYHLDTGRIQNAPPTGWTSPLATTPDKQTLVYGLVGMSARTINTREPLSQHPFFATKVINGGLDRAALSDDGRLLAVSWAGNVKFTKVFDLASEKTLFSNQTVATPRFILQQNPDAILQVAGNPWFFSHEIPSDADLSKLAPPKNITDRRSEDGKTSFYFGHTGTVSHTLSISDTQFLTASRDFTLRLWERPKPSRPAGNSALEFYHPTASHSGEYLAYRLSNGNCAHEHLPSGHITEVPRDQVYIAAFNDGRFLTKSQTKGIITCWQTSPTEPLKKLWETNPGAGNPYNAHAIHSVVSLDERSVAYLQPGHLVTIDMENQSALITTDQTMSFGTSPGQTATISDDGKFAIVTAFRGEDARLYRTDDLTQYESLLPAAKHATRDCSCVFSRDSSKIYVGNNDGWIRVFDTATRKEITSESWKAHSSEVTALTISQSGDVIASAAGDSTYLWSAEKETGKERRLRLRFKTGSANRNWLQFCKDDTLLLHCGPQTPIQIWPAPKTPAAVNPPPEILPVPKPANAVSR